MINRARDNRSAAAWCTLLMLLFSACGAPSYLHPPDSLLRSATAVEVRPRWGWPIVDAGVMMRTPDGSEFHARFDERYGIYRFDTLIERGTLHISHPDFAARIVPLEPGPERGELHRPSPHRVLLGRPGDEWTYVHGGMMPYPPDYSAIGVIPEVMNFDDVRNIADSLGLSASRANITGWELYILTSSTPFDRTKDERLRVLRRMPGVGAAGPFVNREGGVILTEMFYLSFTGMVGTDECERILRSRGYIRYDGTTDVPSYERVAHGTNRYIIRADPSLSYGMNDIMESFARHPDVLEVAAELRDPVLGHF